MHNFHQDFTFTIRNDYAFKKLFASPEGRPVLREFLSLVLKIPKPELAEITIENPFTLQAYSNTKQGILDLKLALQNGKKINLEMQNQSQSFFPERILFYWANRYTENFAIGENYSTLKKCINITLINDSFEYANTVHSLYKLINVDDSREFDDLLELHFLNLSKIPASNPNEISLTKLSELEKWLLFIRTNNSEVRSMLAKENTTLDYANQTMNRFFSNKEERLQYEAAFRYECDRASLIAESHNKGVKQGIQQEKNTIAKNLLALNIPIEDIVSATGLSEETILSL
ncbi:Rpn family recombination-promoting nuclease/putative transposase [Clostridiales bacterium COT073_COT-073]|nr:Rpn family recombination-promoting nuclease/putative transposase [Clostridiales bacterium COT073_COT-073]